MCISVCACVRVRICVDCSINPVNNHGVDSEQTIHSNVCLVAMLKGILQNLSKMKRNIREMQNTQWHGNYS